MPRFTMITPLVAIFSCGCLSATPALSDMYKWTDAEGKVHYSDQPPPPNVKQTDTVKPRSPVAPAAAPEAGGAPAAAPKSYVEQDAEFNRRRVEKAEREAAEKKAADAAAEKKRYCTDAKAELARMRGGVRVARFDDKGEPVYLSDAEIAREAERAKQVADAACK